MSRRCLQGILREQGYQQKDLVQQIAAVLDEADPKKQLPIALHETVSFGNLGTSALIL
jgi:hypothetical protein